MTSMTTRQCLARAYLENPVGMERHSSPSPEPVDATQVTEEQAREQEQLDHQADDPDAPGRHQDRHQIADET
jgi:hypothetical protein